MLNHLRSAALAAGLALAPLAAGAATIDPDSTATPGAVLTFGTAGQAWDFAARFTKGDGPDGWDFVFHNTSHVDRWLNLAASVTESRAAMFDTGAQVQIADFLLDSFGEDFAETENGSVLIAANSTETLTIRFGNLLARNHDSAALVAFTATVAPIPLPATGLLLLGAMGGLWTLRRRRQPA